MCHILVVLILYDNQIYSLTFILYLYLFYFFFIIITLKPNVFQQSMVFPNYFLYLFYLASAVNRLLHFHANFTTNLIQIALHVVGELSEYLRDLEEEYEWRYKCTILLYLLSFCYECAGTTVIWILNKECMGHRTCVWEWVLKKRVTLYFDGHL